MKQKALVLFFIGVAVSVFSQNAETALQKGLRLYREGGFAKAVSELRQVGPEDGDYPEALYWTGLSLMSLGNYGDALEALDTLEKLRPGEKPELPYHRGRILFYLGKYEEALIALSDYSVKEENKTLKAASLYWAGECLYALGQLDAAESVFAGIVEKYPDSSKYQASLYRMELIRQKKIEAELLSILSWTHEESLKTQEEYRRREQDYDLTIMAYQKRIAELQGDTIVSDLELSNEDYKTRLNAAEQKIASLESTLGEAAVLEQKPGEVPSYTNRDTALRLLSLKNDVLALQNAIMGRSTGAGK
ncbi:MAG: tetratricopeptide repeat protein [Treponema sp.]|jgi:tetratricopeptide (TPR) repeat protein|nr:tetratricopeptide repeat protein [Treponema sp.]